MEISQQFKQGITVFALLLVVFSCKPVEEVQPDYEKLLVSSPWTFSEEVSLDPINATVVNTLLNNTTLTFNTGGEIISNLFTIDATNTWELNADNTAIIIDKGLDSEDEWIIVSMTETEFVYRDNDDGDASGGALPFTYTDGKPLELKFIH